MTHVLSSILNRWCHSDLPDQLEGAIDRTRRRLWTPDLETDWSRCSEERREGEYDAVLQGLVIEQERVSGDVHTGQRSGQYVTDTDNLTLIKTTELNEIV